MATVLGWYGVVVQDELGSVTVDGGEDGDGWDNV